MAVPSAPSMTKASASWRRRIGAAIANGKPIFERDADSPSHFRANAGRAEESRPLAAMFAKSADLCQDRVGPFAGKHLRKQCGRCRRCFGSPACFCYAFSRPLRLPVLAAVAVAVQDIEVQMGAV